MELLMNTSNPMIVVLYTVIAVCLIIVGKKCELPVLPGILVLVSVVLLVSHTLKLEGISSEESAVVVQTYTCLAYDFILLLLSFISFLWVDSIVAKKRNKKTYDDGLSWFWDKI